ELGSQRILREIPRAGAIWYELTHDRFIHPVLESNAGWRTRWRRRVVFPPAAVLLLLVPLSMLIAVRNRKALIESQQLLDQLKADARAQPASAVALGLAQWRLHNYGQARVLFNRVREAAPLEGAQTIEDGIQAAMKTGDPALEDLRAARWEFLRDPVI